MFICPKSLKNRPGGHHHLSGLTEGARGLAPQDDALGYPDAPFQGWGVCCWQASAVPLTGVLRPVALVATDTGLSREAGRPWVGVAVWIWSHGLHLRCLWRWERIPPFRRRASVRLCPAICSSAGATPTRNRNREQGTGNREQGTGNREQGTGNRKQETGNREQETGNKTPARYSPLLNLAPAACVGCMLPRGAGASWAKLWSAVNVASASEPLSGWSLRELRQSARCAPGAR